MALRLNTSEKSEIVDIRRFCFAFWDLPSIFRWELPGAREAARWHYLRERRHLPGRVGSGGARAANIRSNYNCERSSQYNTRQFQCNSCPAGSLFKFSLTVHRTAVSHGGRPGQSLPEGHLPLLLLPYLMLLHHTNVARRQPILATRP